MGLSNLIKELWKYGVKKLAAHDFMAKNENRGTENDENTPSQTPVDKSTLSISMSTAKPEEQVINTPLDVSRSMIFPG